MNEGSDETREFDRSQLEDGLGKHKKDLGFDLT